MVDEPGPMGGMDMKRWCYAGSALLLAGAWLVCHPAEAPQLMLGSAIWLGVLGSGIGTDAP